MKGSVKMKKLVSTVGLSREEWLLYRKRGIGGSDAGAVCGLNPYVSPLKVYLDKISEEISDEDNEAMRIGRDLEEYVAQRFTEATGLKVRKKNAMLYHEDYPFMLADVDRMIVGENAGLECKTASPYSADKWKDDNAPAHYVIQCHHYMAVTGADAWYLAVLIMGKGFEYRKIERDEEIIRYLRRIESDFWQNNVLQKVMPDPDGSKACEEILREYFPSATRDTVIDLPEFREKLKRREEIMVLLDRMETEKNQIEQEIKKQMGDAESAICDRYNIRWSNVLSRRFDSKKLQEEQPEIYSQYLSESRSRRFQIKAAS